MEPEIFETIKLLNSMGAAIHYDAHGKKTGDDFIYVESMARLEGTRFRIMSDPNVLVSYAVMAMITNGRVVVENIDPSDKVDVFLEILSRMNADYSYNMEERSLELLPSLARLKPVDLETNFWPADVKTLAGRPALCHTDWQQILTPLLAKLEGESFIDENVHPERFTTIEALKGMGAKLELIGDSNRIKRRVFKEDGKPHTLKITGPTKFRSASIGRLRDIRGATGVLSAMLSADGTSILHGVDQLQRGMENVVSNLESLGASVNLA